MALEQCHNVPPTGVQEHYFEIFDIHCSAWGYSHGEESVVRSIHKKDDFLLVSA